MVDKHLAGWRGLVQSHYRDWLHAGVLLDESLILLKDDRPAFAWA